ncbi:hypothetical protein JXA47_13765 [Candidatus Sumerlaeota bacterium]|nr:hypothetical protein [Candidatus Sumerlaeota bacterium]
MIRSLLCALIALGGTAAALAQPLEFDHQGRLLDASGVPITTPTEVRFEIIRGGTAGDEATGSQVYRETVLVTPDATGIFSHRIGSSPDTGFVLEPPIFQTGLPIYLQMRVPASGAALLPRTQLVSVPYAIVASELDRAPEVVNVPVLDAGVLYGATADPSDDVGDLFGLRIDNAGNGMIADGVLPLAWDGSTPELEVYAEILGSLSGNPAQRDVLLSFRMHGIVSGAAWTWEGTHTFTSGAPEQINLPLVVQVGTPIAGEPISWSYGRRWDMPQDSMPNSLLLLAAQLRYNATR